MSARARTPASRAPDARGEAQTVSHSVEEDMRIGSVQPSAFQDVVPHHGDIGQPRHILLADVLLTANAAGADEAANLFRLKSPTPLQHEVVEFRAAFQVAADSSTGQDASWRVCECGSAFHLSPRKPCHLLSSRPDATSAARQRLAREETSGFRPCAPVLLSRRSTTVRNPSARTPSSTPQAEQVEHYCVPRRVTILHNCGPADPAESRLQMRDATDLI